MIAEALAELRVELLAARAKDTDYVLHGSIVMWMADLREEETIGDIDLFVTPKVWNRLQANGWTPWPDHPTVTVRRRCGELTAAAENSWDDRHPLGDIYAEAFAAAEEVMGWQVIPLEMLHAWKTRNIERHFKHRAEKDRADAAAIAEYLGL